MDVKSDQKEEARATVVSQAKVDQAWKLLQEAGVRTMPHVHQVLAITFMVTKVRNFLLVRNSKVCFPRSIDRRASGANTVQRTETSAPAACWRTPWVSARPTRPLPQP